MNSFLFSTIAPRILFLLALLTPEFARANPTLPTIPANTFNVTDYGAIGDGVTTNTTAIQNAINAANAAHGGTVEIPAGIFLSGPLTLSSSINLQIDSGAILRMLPYGEYPGGTSPADFITASSLHDIEISGAGTVDGQADDSGWWNGLSTSERPALLFLNKCNRVLIQNVTLENSPSMHIVFKGSNGGNITVQGIVINTSGSSPNTDGIDLIGTNCLVQNCSISDGDDNIALGSTGGTSSDTIITNCNFGVGHGLSIGSNTSGGVSNLTVVACSFNGTQYGIRMKSDNNTSSGGEGGLAQNLFYENIQMTNITRAPIVIYSYYSEFGTPIGIAPATAAAEPIPSPVPPTTAIWRNIVISNLTATVADGGIAGIIWGRTEMPVTNIILDHVNITAPGTFDIFNTYGFQFINSQISSGVDKTFTIYNAGIIVTNDSVGAGTVTLDGLTGASSSLALYNASASTTATDIFGANPITLSGGAISVGNDLSLPNSEQLNFALGSNASEMTASGDLTFNGATINVTNAAGFGAGTYTLFTYAGNLSGNFSLGAAPTNFNCVLDTNTVGQINLIVSEPGPSLAPVNLASRTIGNQLQLFWPADHIGWQLEIQTNSLNAGLGTNWTILSGSEKTNEIFLPIQPANGSVFLRLIYSQP